MIPLLIAQQLVARLAAGEIDLATFETECEHWRALCSEVLGW